MLKEMPCAERHSLSLLNPTPEEPLSQQTESKQAVNFTFKVGVSDVEQTACTLKPATGCIDRLNRMGLALSASQEGL